MARFDKTKNLRSVRKQSRREDNPGSSGGGEGFKETEMDMVIEMREELWRERERSRDLTRRILELETRIAGIQSSMAGGGRDGRYDIVKGLLLQMLLQDGLGRTDFDQNLVMSALRTANMDTSGRAGQYSPMQDPGTLESAALSGKEATVNREENGPFSKRGHVTPLNSSMRFSDMVVDESNRFAFLACEAASGDGFGKFNPILINGPVGTGKTHLLNAIANEVLEKDHNKCVIQISADSLSFNISGLASSRSEMEKADLLLLEDVQKIADPVAQAELLHLLTVFEGSGRQIVLSADRHPGALQDLDKTLRSHLEGGLVLGVSTPSFEGRRQLLYNLAQKEGISLSSEVLDYMAFYVDTNVRELKGKLNRIIAYSSLMKEPITTELAKKILEEPTQSGEDRLHAARSEKGEEIDLVAELLSPTPSPKTLLDLEEETDEIQRELLTELRKQTME